MTNIVILTRNRLRLLNQTIDSLYAHTPADQFNCTVVDDGSDDFRVKRLLRKIDKPNFSLLEVSNSEHRLSQLKNLGVYWSGQRWGRGDWLCICDNDVYFKEGWLGSIASLALACREYDFELFGGQAHPFHQSFRQFIDKRWEEYDCLAGTHWFMPWSTWDKYGPFKQDTAPGVCQSEDWEFTQRLRANGGCIAVTDPPCVIDCGITQTDGKLSPGADLKVNVCKAAGVYYE